MLPGEHMQRQRIVGSASALLAFLVVMCVGSRPAAAAHHEAAAVGVKALIGRTNAVMKNHGSLREFEETFFEEDLMLTGEGDKTFYRSLQEFEKPLAGYVADQTRCKLSVIDPVRSSGVIAAAFVQLHCDPAKAGDAPVESRILYVFRNGKKGWRAMMEMYSAGVLQ